jgi:hypothetical protein
MIERATKSNMTKKNHNHKQKQNTHARARTWNLRFRRAAPYPLGHAGLMSCVAMACESIIYKLQLSSLCLSVPCHAPPYVKGYEAIRLIVECMPGRRHASAEVDEVGGFSQLSPMCRGEQSSVFGPRLWFGLARRHPGWTGEAGARPMYPHKGKGRPPFRGPYGTPAGNYGMFLRTPYV